MLGRTSHPLEEILFLCLTGTLSGMETWDEIEEFGNLQLPWFRKYFPFRNGIPSHDTLNRVIGLIKVEVFQHAFINWVHDFFKMPVGFTGEHIAIDGKGISNSATKKSRQISKTDGGSNGAFIVNAWSATRGVCVGQFDISEKNSEPQGGLSILQLIDIQDAIISGDANFCQKPIAAYIIEEQANYLFSLKGNKGTIHTEVKKTFDQCNDFLSMSEQHDKGHGRVEQRNVEVISASKLLNKECSSGWEGLQTFIRVRSTRYTISTEKTETDSRYYMSSLSPDTDAAIFGKFIRDHWQIENTLHWSLDVIFSEDASNKRSNNAAVNLSVMKKMALSMHKNMVDKKKTMKLKIIKCAISPEYREKTLRF